MPAYQIHKKIGFIVSLIIGIIIFILAPSKIQLKSLEWIGLAFVILFYSNLCDLDFHIGLLKKKVLKIIFFIMLLSSVILLFVHIGTMLVLLGLTGILGLGLLKVKHRGPLHTYWFVLLASLPMLLIHWFLFVMALLCSFSHIFVDRLFSKWKRKAKKFFGISGQTHHHYWHFRL